LPSQDFIIILAMTGGDHLMIISISASDSLAFCVEQPLHDKGKIKYAVGSVHVFFFRVVEQPLHDKGKIKCMTGGDHLMIISISASDSLAFCVEQPLHDKGKIKCAVGSVQKIIVNTVVHLMFSKSMVQNRLGIG
ncbi:hypothetical protein ACJX0J_010706, partial [Zea mays]